MPPPRLVVCVIDLFPHPFQYVCSTLTLPARRRQASHEQTSCSRVLFPACAVTVLFVVVVGGGGGLVAQSRECNNDRKRLTGYQHRLATLPAYATRYARLLGSAARLLGEIRVAFAPSVPSRLRLSPW